MRFEDGWSDVWLPKRLNDGPWVASHALPDLEARVGQGARIVLPICSFGQSLEKIAHLGDLVLAPLFIEAMDGDLRKNAIEQILAGFPYVTGSAKRRDFKGRVEVIDVASSFPPPLSRRPRVIAFSVDTAVEEHGPHLPLATDRIQSYAALEQAARELGDDVMLAPPLDYGHLRWGLPAGMSVDLTTELTTRYTARYIEALAAWAKPDAVYVVDVHGSPLHRKAVDDGVRAANVGKTKKQFRYLHEPLADDIAKAGDPHAGGIETAIIQAINPALVDSAWWPSRAAQLAAEEMKLPLAIDLAKDMPRFIAYAESHKWNGIVGNIANFDRVDGKQMLKRMCDVAQDDLRALL